MAICRVIVHLVISWAEGIDLPIDLAIICPLDLVIIVAFIRPRLGSELRYKKVWQQTVASKCLKYSSNLNE